MMGKVVVWDELSVLQMERQLNYIKEESPTQAEKVRDSILDKAAELSTFYERYPKDQIQNGK